MPRFVITHLLASALTASAADDKNYGVVKSARIFAIGGIRREGAITAEETAFNAI